jgi:uncharacterized protein
MIRIRVLMLTLALLLLGPVCARAYDYTKGMDAYAARDFIKARKVFQALAEAGDARAQYRIGAMYEFAIGGAADHATAFKWYRKAADRDNVDAQFALGEHLLTARDEHANPSEAIAFFSKAAAHGHLHALLLLAICYRDGAGVPADIVMAHVYASIDTAQMGKVDLVERGKLSKELASIMTEAQRAESKELQLQGMSELKRLPAASKTGQK